MAPDSKGSSSRKLLVLLACLALASITSARSFHNPFAQDIVPRQDDNDKCSAKNPCREPKACCNGNSGYCGFEPEHCGDECVADCESKPECGKYADPPGKECPLNVCCSAWGYCGTTEDFCDEDCQSNCEEKGITGRYDNDVRDQVIGYFASWSLLQRSCSQRDVSHIRYDSQTHINVAFGFIEPGSYEIYPIRGSTIKGWQDITSLKQKAPGLKVWLALGGWSFSDNDTVTQPVFGDLSSSSAKRSSFISKLKRFMLEWGFDGVDLDWEYPGAPDRGGKERDTQNYVELVKDIRRAWDEEDRGWGLSIAAPTSFWYLRWFDIGNMWPYLDWINLMTYDIHGSWDGDSTWIGPYVYAHTNMTEIKQGLNLLWRNDVPANKVQLGLAFYGRTYKLKDPDCDVPGCPFDGPGVVGQCSGTAGYMSYADIEYTIQEYSPKVIKDEKEEIMYFTYGDDDYKNWVSYDNEETIQAKVKFANEMGLRGLFIWATDQDTLDNDLLNAVLQPDGLGKFKDKNGVGGSGSDWESVDLEEGCFWSDCNGQCPPRTISIEDVRCHSFAGAPSPRRHLCCPMDSAPDPDTCTWRGAEFLGGFWCEVVDCPTGEQRIATSDFFKDGGGGDEACVLGGKVSYCCDIESGGPLKCEWKEDDCIEMDGQTPKEDYDCGRGKKFVTHRRGHCGSDRWEPFCCDDDIGDDVCHWRARPFEMCYPGCDANEISFGRHNLGGGHNCQYSIPGANPMPLNPQPHFITEFPKLCCDADALETKLKELPIPLQNLFPDWEDIPDSDEQSFEVEVDGTMGGQRKSTSDDHPDANSFGWHIMSGPDDQITSLKKRDGSHWRVYDCDSEAHEGRQTAKMVCTDESEDGNCHRIFKGGVERTVIEMPPHCGAGKYAMAVEMRQLDRAEVEASLPENDRRRLWKRGIELPKVYNLTFDYDFSVLQGRQDNKVRLRIDYSDNPGYWSSIVAAPPSKFKKRDFMLMKRQVETQHNGDWRAYVDHKWSMEKRSTPDEGLEDLHKRWFALAVQDWIDRQRQVDLEYDLVRHGIHENFRWTLFEDSVSCPRFDARAEIWATLSLNIETAAVITIIGNLNDLSSFDQSYATFRNKGDVKVSFNFAADAELRFTTGPAELFGLAPLGASFKIPGIATLGPQFRMVAELNGRASLHANAHVAFDIMEWDFFQHYPYTGDDAIEDETKKEPKIKNPREGIAVSGEPQFTYDVSAEGMIEAKVTPMITFGIVFDSKLEVPNTAIDMGVDAYARMYASAGSSSAIAWEYCYGAEAGYSVFARVAAPTLFGVNLSNRWDLLSDEFDLIPRECSSSED